jgi:eukaryotic-like serine/threonine-protein kinase
MGMCPTCSLHFDGDETCPNDGTTLLPDDVAPKTEPRLVAGEMVGEYRVEGILGEGGFGSVYKSLHPLIGKRAAIKVLKREFSSKADIVSRFLAEARAVNQIRHRNIIDIFSFGVLPDGRHYYVMELLDGVTLDAHVKSRGGRLPLGETIGILRPLARALGAAHSHNIAHRDLKPENVFLTLDDEGRPIPKLLDFGIAKLAGDMGSQHKTRSGIPMGTPSYMSPEQVHGRAVDHRTDIYAFGVVVFEILAGRLPFEGHSVMDVLMKHATLPPPRISSVAPWVPAAVDAVLMRMMEKSPEDRPENILAAVDELTAAAASAGIQEATSLPPLATSSGPGAITPHVMPSASKLDFSTGATIVAPDTSKTFAGTEHDQSSSRGSRRIWVVGAAALLAAAGLGIFMVSRMPPGAATSASAAASVVPAAVSAEAPSSAVPASSVRVEPTSSAKPAPTAVKLRIKSVPPDAEVFLGKDKLGMADKELELPFGDSEVTLTVKRRGYLPAEVKVKPDRDLAEAVVLKPAPVTKKDYSFE